MPLPFGVDTERFTETKPISERSRVFVYCKNRSPVDYDMVFDFLKHYGIEYTVFNYRTRYEEDEYLACLKDAKYGIWIDGHESQGFALQEALSCNIPLLVWNVRSMNQEHGQSYPDIPATSIPYWDARCGEYFYDFPQIDVCFKEFVKNVERNKYRPREYVVENLSIDVCERRFIDVVNMI